MEKDKNIPGYEPDLDTVLSERGKTHGEFRVHAKITQDLKKTMRETDNWRYLNGCQRESLEMIAHKIGRILAGNPDYRDHWEDIEGYARIAKIRPRMDGEKGKTHG